MKFLQTTTFGLLSNIYIAIFIDRQKKRVTLYGATLLFRLYAIYNYLELIGQFGKLLF